MAMFYPGFPEKAFSCRVVHRETKWCITYYNYLKHPVKNFFFNGSEHYYTIIIEQVIYIKLEKPKKDGQFYYPKDNCCDVLSLFFELTGVI